MQPSHATEYTLADGFDNWSRRLGADRAAQGWRCGDLARVALYDADLTVFAENPREVPGDDLVSLPVTVTIVDGQVFHRSG